MSTSCLPEHDVLDPGNGAIGARRPEHAQLVGTHPRTGRARRRRAGRRRSRQGRRARRTCGACVPGPCRCAYSHERHTSGLRATALFFHNLSESERIGDHRIHPALGHFLTRFYPARIDTKYIHHPSSFSLPSSQGNESEIIQKNLNSPELVSPHHAAPRASCRLMVFHLCLAGRIASERRRTHHDSRSLWCVGQMMISRATRYSIESCRLDIPAGIPARSC